MSWFKSDLVAIACVLGGAAVGGAATFAMMDGAEHSSRCGISRTAVSPKIAISGRGKARAIVVTPDVRVHAKGDCVSGAHEIVEIHLENQLEQLDAQLEHLDHVLEVQLEGLEAQIEAEVAAEMDARFKYEEAVRQIEEARVRMIVERVGGGGI
jgi:hypothetical protein